MKKKNNKKNNNNKERGIEEEENNKQVDKTDGGLSWIALDRENAKETS